MITNEYISNKMNKGLLKVSNEIENKVITFLEECQLEMLQFEDILKGFTGIKRFAQICSQMKSHQNEKLLDYAQKKFISYFTYYHTCQLDELRLFLENESWELCPAESITEEINFTQADLHSSLKERLVNSKNFLRHNCLSNDQSETSCCILSNEELFKENFISNADEFEENIRASQSSLPSDSFQALIISQHSKNSNHTICTSTTLHIMRICKKYIRFSKIFNGCMNQIIKSMNQLFELYLLILNDNFTENSDIYNTSNDTTLKRSLSRVKECLIQNRLSVCQYQMEESESHCLISKINLSNLSRLDNFTQRVIATESLLFLSQQYQYFSLHLKYFITSNQDELYFIKLFQENIDSATVLKKLIFISLIIQFFDKSKVMDFINEVDWSIEHVSLQYNNYVDVVIQELQNIKVILCDVQNKVPITKDTYDCIWECAAQIIANVLVEGYSNAKVCSTGGRALMQLDFIQLTSNFESITNLKPMPYQEYVLTFIKAFYLSEENLESWIKQQSDYSRKHIIGLITSTIQHKKLRQKFLNLVEDRYSSKGFC
ncbi:syndetin [Trichogramma pretiosum]|uniref:syndetin n=1 Tax=Trichogramma pretiosum TaxID=7493 RepID=UPI0006C93CBD|nr:syndetin [Trichogramma pretiosum]